MVLRHLYAILMFVFLNMLVTFLICGEMLVNVAHFLFLLSCGVGRSVLCSIWCLSLCITVGGKPFCWAICRIYSTLLKYQDNARCNKHKINYIILNWKSTEPCII